MADTGKIDQMKGRVREAYGDLTDDPEQKQKGAIDKFAGKVKEGVEKTREKVSEGVEKTREKLHDAMDRTHR